VAGQSGRTLPRCGLASLHPSTARHPSRLPASAPPAPLPWHRHLNCDRLIFECGIQRSRSLEAHVRKQPAHCGRTELLTSEAEAIYGACSHGL
jgi:hypothetical protein